MVFISLNKFYNKNRVELFPVIDEVKLEQKMSRSALIPMLVVGVAVVLPFCRKHVDSFHVTKPVETASHTLVADTNTVNASFGGYYVALPHQYNASGKKFPLLVFLHGLGQRGNGKDGLPYLLFDGIGKAIKDNRFPATFSVRGEEFSMVVVSPQYDIQPHEEEVMQVIDTIVNRYRIRTNRIYLSGLSLGARIATTVAAKYPQQFAALVPIAGVATADSFEVRCEKIARANLPVWAFHNADDPMSNVNDSRRFIDYINEHHPATPPRLTVFDQYGHDAWTKALDTAYREDGKNMYEWMLQYYR